MRGSKRALLLGSLFGAIAPSGMVGLAHAQEASAESASEAEIIVTARRREETAQEVPGVVQALSGDTLAQFGAQGVEDIIGMSAGVEFVNGTGQPGNNDIIIRGAGAGRFTNTDSSSGLYVNGAYVSGGNLGGRTLNESDLFDLERVEILKGPQGALLGRNALGGSINAISRRPDYQQSSGEIAITALEQEGRTLEASFEAPLVSDVLAFRVAGRASEGEEGFFFNPYLNEYTDRYDEQVARGLVTARFSPNVELLLQLDYYDVDRAGSLAADLDVVDDPFNWAQDDDNRNSQTQYNALAGLTWELGHTTFSALINHRDRDSASIEDLDQGVASALPFDPTAQTACYTVTSMMVTTTPPLQRCVSETTDDFASTFYSAHLQNEAGPLNWIIGADYLEASDRFVQERSGQDVNSVILASTNEVDSLALWGGLELEVTRRLSAGVDVRYTSEDKQQSSRATFTFGPSAGTDAYSNALDFSFDQTTYAAFARFEITDNFAFYGRAGTGFRSGGLNVDARDLDNPATVPIDPAIVPDTYDPEHALSYELGVRSQWFGGALFANVTVFQIEYDDYLQNLNNGLTGVNRIQYVSNTGDAEVIGVEYEFSGRVRGLLGGWLDWQLGAVNASSEITNGPNQGLETTRLPEWSLAGRATFRHGFVGNWDWRLGLRYTQQWGGFTAASNDIGLQEPQLFSLTAGIDNPNWSAALTVENITDEDEPYNFTGQNIVSPRVPSNWSVRVARRF
ncbi:MAG: hypothetical protein DCF16_04610 [Alphaproteobacteria bacterium]|nr:MAG: hypothetical protein DCF16_04610 [Alphaproteobacteria bacterium]